MCQLARKKVLIIFYFLSLMVFLSLSLPFSGQIKKKRPEDLPPKYRKWLEEEVVYLITPKEKEVFLQLETDRDRDLFIEGFWKQRDPNPATPENEAKQEHYRRIEYANKNFGRESPGPGWRSDMGRIYILLGEPKSVEKFENLTETYPVIVWFYSGMGEYGLPDSFYVVFFKEGGAGDYKLYSPLRYGPQHLLIHYYGDQTDYETAYRELYKVNSLLAEVSLSLIPGEAQTLTPSIASELLISSKIPSVPREKVKDTWAEKLLAYKDIIEVEYSTNYIDSDFEVKVIQAPEKIYFVHYLIEPKKLSVEQVGDKYYTRLEVNGMVNDEQGRLVYQFDRSLPIELTSERLANIRARLFSFQDVFPLIPGRFRLHVLLKNVVSKEFTSFEANLDLPETTRPLMTKLLLAYRLDKASPYQGSTKPFLIRGMQFVPTPRHDFSSRDHLYLHFQLLNLSKEQKEKWLLEYVIFQEEKKVLEVLKEVNRYPFLPDVIEEFSLTGLPPAHYRLRVRLLDETRQEVVAQQSSFYVSPASTLPRAWVASFPLPPSADPLFANLLGGQYLERQELEKARYFLEQAYRQRPLVAKYALDYTRLLLELKRYEEAKGVILPFLSRPEKNEFLLPFAQASQAMGELEEVIKYYKEYLERFGAQLSVLNSLGDCYYQLGLLEEALAIWQKSLEINPQQEDLKKKLASIKK